MSYIVNHIHAKLYYYLQYLTIGECVSCFIIVLFALVVFYLVRHQTATKRAVISILLKTIYLTLLFAITILGRRQFQASFPNQFFASFDVLLSGNGDIVFDILFNIVLFVPAGILFAIDNSFKKTNLIIFLLTLFIETVQAVTRRGLFELSDILANYIGGMCGYILYSFMRHCIRRGRKHNTQYIERVERTKQ